MEGRTRKDHSAADSRTVYRGSTPPQERSHRSLPSKYFSAESLLLLLCLAASLLLLPVILPPLPPPPLAHRHYRPLSASAIKQTVVSPPRGAREVACFGYDPFGLSKKPEDFAKYKASELIHAKDLEDKLNPGGPFDPAGLANEAALLEVKETKSRWLAMLAMLGLFLQADSTGQRAVENPMRHPSEPFGNNLLAMISGTAEGASTLSFHSYFFFFHDFHAM
ncbi:hypothetical protein OPV22_026882 [Ensete ventricosum]|uniref:Chlorophyll a-b binding protein, chloroplastic n=1 Tax=Ensete ventricosum TaxID=4639 RepID=A0AAV8Q6A4_ENSVE|nr:hypothetical protein OPV22_026882 [Ensete ventricosum]